VRKLSTEEKEKLLSFGQNLTDSQVDRVKEIEKSTKHDVKAMERTFRELLKGTSLEDVTEMIHFALTSEDVNNISYRLLFKRALTQVVVPALDSVVDGLVERAKEYRDIPMLARTHGQPAIPTTLGKEFANFAVRLNKQVRKLAEAEITGKLNGAVGNFNAHTLAAPEVDWIDFSKRFVKSLGLKPNLFTTQINPYDDMIETFQNLQRINNIFVGIDQDMWRYISDDWFAQKIKIGEVGSSTMPQKVNPIDSENSEGNAQVSNAFWGLMSRKLAVSRLQRDLSDSTVVRNVGSGLAYGLLAYKNTLSGLGRISPNVQVINETLNENWMILTEGVQTVLRRSGEKDPYSLVAGLSKGNKIGPKEWKDWVNALPISDELKERFAKLTPESYIGQAPKLTDMAMAEIEESRKRG
jgi:adenylosuccinate lyase